MGTELKHKLTFIILSLRVIEIGTVSAKQAEFDLHKGLQNTFCSDHATSVGVVTSLLTCGERCMAFSDCLGFFYGTVNKMCTVVNVIAIPQNGCTQESDTNYFVRRVADLFNVYHYTQYDLDRMSTNSEYSVCMSYSYHVWHTDLGSKSQYGCEHGWCCTTKGCYSDPANLYNGTWSRTQSGLKCQSWSQQTPHPHGQPIGTLPPGETLATAMNYCRDPDNTGEPWCYTMDPDVNREVCGMPAC